MSDEQKPNLSLGEPPGRLGRRSRAPSRLSLWLLLMLQTVTLAVLLIVVLRRNPIAPGVASNGESRGENLRAVAMELEDKSLNGPAARAWESYLVQAGEVSEKAEILYRIGRLYLAAEEYDRAAAAFVRSEQLASGNKELKEKIGPQMVTCLRRLGLYGEVGRELSRRVEVGARDTSRGKVLATLQGDPVTEADLDRMIERRVDQMLAMQGAAGNASARETLLRQLAGPDTRQQLFQELLQTELFTRRARELNLDQEQDFIDSRRALEDDLLASRFQARELDKIQPTDVDLESFFKANESTYKEPESLDVAFFEIAAHEAAQDVLQRINSAEDFKKVAAEREGSSAKDNAAPPTRRLVQGRPDPQLGNVDDLFALDAGRWTQEPHSSGGKQYLVLVESKNPSRTPTLAEVRPRVEADYVTRKRQELGRQLIADLMRRYQVRIMPAENSAGAHDNKSSEDSPADDNQSDGGTSP